MRVRVCVKLQEARHLWAGTTWQRYSMTMKREVI